MQPRDGRDKAESEPGAWGMSALLGAVKTSQYGIALGLGDTRTGVADFDAQPPPTGGGAHCDPPPGRRELDRVIDEVADRFEQEARIARDFGRGAVGLKRQRDPFALGHRLVELGHVRSHSIEVEYREAGTA